MRKKIIYLLSYLYIKLIKSNIKVDISARISPFFAIKKLSKLNYVDLDKAIIGRDVNISEGLRCFESPIIVGNVSIGRYTSINGPGTRIFAYKNKIIIGSFCSIASNVIIQEYNHNYNLITTYNIFDNIFKEPFKNSIISNGSIIIEDDVWIGSNVVILSGVNIGKGAVIGAGSVVTKDIPAFAIAVGNPAKVIKMRFNAKTISKITTLDWSKWNREELIKNKEYFFQEP